MVVDNSEQAMKFYKDIFGWKFEKWDGAMEVLDGNYRRRKRARNQRLSSRKGETAIPMMNTISLSSVDKFSNLIQIKVARY